MSDLSLATIKGRANTVCQNKRVIGFMCCFTLHGIHGWRFISNREDIAARCPVPPTVHETPGEALVALIRRLDVKV